MAADRECLAQLPPDAVADWRQFCDARGLWRSCLVEEIGRWMFENEDSPVVTEWVEAARALMAERNRGRPRE